MSNFRSAGPAASAQELQLPFQVRVQDGTADPVFARQPASRAMPLGGSQALGVDEQDVSWFGSLLGRAAFKTAGIGSRVSGRKERRFYGLRFPNTFGLYTLDPIPDTL